MSAEEFAGTMAVAEAQRFDEAALEKYLCANAPGFVGPLAKVQQFRGGQSNPTFLLTAGDGAQYVLRRKPAGVLLPSAHAVDREFRIISALQKVNFPVARAVCLCEDIGVIGTLFYIMSYVAGRNFWDPSLPDMTPLQRAAIYDEMNKVLVSLHTLDFAAIGLADYGKPGNYFAARSRAGASSTGRPRPSTSRRWRSCWSGCRPISRPGTRPRSCTATTASTT